MALKAVRALVAGGTFGAASRIRDLRESGPLQAAWQRLAEDSQGDTRLGQQKFPHSQVDWERLNSMT